MSIATALGEIVLIFAAGMNAVSPPSADEILTRYERSLVRFNRFSVTAKGATYYHRADQAEERLDSIRTYRVLRDNNRWNSLISQRTYPFGEPAEGYATEFNYVCDGHILEVYYPQKTIGVRPKAPSAVNGSRVATEREQTRAVGFLGQSSLSFGYFTTVDTRQPLAQVFRADALNKETIHSGRDETGDFIESTQKSGDTLRLWVDLESGGILKGLRAIQVADAENANRFKFGRMVVESVYGFARTAAIKSITFEVRNVESALCEDQRVITRFETIRTLEDVQGNKAHERFEGELSDWNLSPDIVSPAAFQPLLPVSEGARVYNPDEEPIQLAYRGGHVVLDINESTVKTLERVQLSTRRSPVRVQWAWAAIAGVLGFIWWRMRVAGES